MKETEAERMFRPGIEISSWPELKFARAAAHLRSLQSEVELWNSTAPVTTDKVLSHDGLTADIVLRLRTAPPAEMWALCLGDALHNMRSSLDALAWELCHLEGRAPSRPNRIYFPICVSEAAWRDASKDLQTIPAPALERIRLTQPFLYQTKGGRSALELLSKLNNHDKHRSLIKSTIRASAIDMANWSIEFQDVNSIPDPPFELDVVPNLKFQDGAVLARITSTAAMLQVRAPLQLSANFQLQVDDEELDMTQTLNLLMQQLRGTLSLVYKGMTDQAPLENDDWTAFTPRVVDEL